MSHSCRVAVLLLLLGLGHICQGIGDSLHQPSTTDEQEIFATSSTTSGASFQRKTNTPLPLNNPSNGDFLLAYKAGLQEVRAMLVHDALHQGAAYSRHLNAAEMHLSRGRYHDAMVSYEYVLRTYGLTEEESAPISLALGHVYAHLSFWEAAQRAYKGAAASRKMAPAAHSALGTLRARQGLFREAAQSFETALYYNPSYFHAVHSLGSVAFISGDIERGLHMYNSAVKILEEKELLPPLVSTTTSASQMDESTNQNQQQQQQQQQVSVMTGETLKAHLINHVLKCFELPTVVASTNNLNNKGGAMASSSSPISTSTSSSISVGANAEVSTATSSSSSSSSLSSSEMELVEIGKSLRNFLRRLQTLDLAAFHRGLGLKLLDAGAFNEALGHLRRAISLEPSEYGNLLLYSTLALPFVFSSEDEIWETRGGLAKNVREALEDRVTVAHPDRLYELYFLTHQLPYMGLPSHLLMRDIARLFASSEAPALEVVRPELYKGFATALSHATQNDRWIALAPHMYTGAPPPPLGAYVRQHVEDYFVWENRNTLMSGSHGQKQSIDLKLGNDDDGDDDAHEETNEDEGGSTTVMDDAGYNDQKMNAFAASGRESTTVVRVGIVTYQLHDGLVGNLLHRLLVHLQGYAAVQSKVMGSASHATSTTSSEKNGGGISRGVGPQSSFIEGPSYGGGTKPRYLHSDLSNWKNHDDDDDDEKADNISATPIITATEDPMISHGYITVPGVAAFNITVFRLHYGGDNLTRRFNADADQVVMLPSRPFDLEGARAAISHQMLDVLIASDPGIQPEMYSLMFARMAPVQVAYWGVERAHTLTLGLPDSVDYYVVGDGVADSRLQDHMQEQTVRLGDLGLYSAPPFPSITEAEKFAAISSFGLLDSRHMYLCPTLLNGLHPHFDAVMVGILRLDPSAEILAFFEGNQQGVWLAKLQTRLQAAAGMTTEMFERIRFTKEFGPNSQREKLALLSSVEVVLDTFPMGIGSTALEALDVGTPVLTLHPKAQHQVLGKHLAAAALTRLGLEHDLIASNKDEYITQAVKIATDPFYRRLLRQKIVGRRVSHHWETSGQGGGGGGAKAEEEKLKEKKSTRTRAQQQQQQQQQYSGPIWRDLPSLVGNISDPTVSSQNVEYLRMLAHQQGYVDPARTTLNDWLRFLGRVGRPWAEDREATELEVATASLLDGGAALSQKAGNKEKRRVSGGSGTAGTNSGNPRRSGTAATERGGGRGANRRTNNNNNNNPFGGRRSGPSRSSSSSSINDASSRSSSSARTENTDDGVREGVRRSPKQKSNGISTS